MSGPTLRRVIVRGHVQGVGYRAFVEDQALMRGLDGWVRNRRDGSVEAVFAGPADAVEAIIYACHRGPETATVEDVAVAEASPEDLDLRHPGEPFSTLMTV